MLKYKIPFDEKIYIEQTILTLPYIYSVEYKKIKEASIIAILFFVVGLLILIGDSDLSTLFFCIAIFVVFDLYVKNENYKRLKDSHIRNLKQLLSENELTSFGIFEFTDDFLRFSNDFMCAFINWKDISNYKIKKNNLLIIPKKHPEETYVIGKAEVNKRDFEKILSFVKEKVN